MSVSETIILKIVNDKYCKELDLIRLAYSQAYKLIYDDNWG